MNTAIILSNQLTGDADLWVTRQCEKFWPEEKLSRSDFRNKPEVMLFFLQEIKQKKQPIEKSIASYFIAFLGELASFLKPIPDLEKVKTKEDMREQFSRVVKQELQRDAPKQGSNGNLCLVRKTTMLSMKLAKKLAMPSLMCSEVEV